MRTYKETLQLIKKAKDYVTQVGKEDNLNLVQPAPAIKAVKTGQNAGIQAGKIFRDLLLILLSRI